MRIFDSQIIHKPLRETIMSKQALKEKIVNRCNRISVLVEKGAPPIILENEQRALNELLGLYNTIKKQ